MKGEYFGCKEIREKRCVEPIDTNDRTTYANVSQPSYRWARYSKPNIYFLSLYILKEGYIL